MNREIKFRAWDKIKKEMLFDSIEYKFRLIEHPYTSKTEEITQIGFSNLDYDRFEIMQFTGLHDKNGKEIYEKDILKQIYYPMGADKKIIEYYKIGVVIYGSHFFGLQLKIEGTNVLDESKKLSHHRTRKEVYKHPSAGGDWVDNSFYGEYEIIGNVYENPELLNK